MPDWNRRFLSLAAHVAGWSKDPSTKCGAVIVRPDRTVASMGYNGLPRGLRDALAILEDREEKYKRVIHAEMNALLFLREPVNGYVLYTWPILPCCRCATHVIQKGIRLVVAPIGSRPLSNRHNLKLSRAMFKEVGIQVKEIDT